MATEEVPVTKESLEEKLGELKIKEPEKFQDATEAPAAESPEEAKGAVLDELKESPPELHHVETKDTTDPAAGPTSEDGVVKAEVPEAFAEELKSDHDIVPPAKETPTVSTVHTSVKETGPEGGESAPTTKESPVEVTHEDVDTKPPSKISSILDKIGVGKE